eukprot:355647-Chlamydomonas_euryale.AAC.5
MIEHGKRDARTWAEVTGIAAHLSGAGTAVPRPLREPHWWERAHLTAEGSDPGGDDSGGGSDDGSDEDFGSELHSDASTLHSSFETDELDDGREVHEAGGGSSAAAAGGSSNAAAANGDRGAAAAVSVAAAAAACSAAATAADTVERPPPQPPCVEVDGKSVDGGVVWSERDGTFAARVVLPGGGGTHAPGGATRAPVRVRVRGAKGQPDMVLLLELPTSE